MKRCLNCQRAFEGVQWICPQCGFRPVEKEHWISFAPDLAVQAEGFEAGFFEHLAPAEVGHFWFDSRNRIILWALQRFFPEAHSYLEVGCGSGYVLQNVRRHAPELQLAGSELFDSGLVYAHQRLPDVSLYQMDARSIPFLAEFDVIGAYDVIEHIEDDERVFQEMYNALRPNGGVILTVPQHPWLWSAIDDYSHHCRRYNRSDLLTKIRRAGFEVRFATSFVTLLLPLMLISRRRQPKSAQQIDPMSEFRINPLLNRALKSVLSFEHLLIRMGLSLPVGGSLFVVAQKRETLR